MLARTLELRSVFQVRPHADHSDLPAYFPRKPVTCDCTVQICSGSHRDTRNPRGPNDNICVSAPIPGEMQVSCPRGSVYIQDSR